MLYDPTGGFPTKLLRTQLIDHCHSSPTCLAIQMRCVYGKMLKQQEGICGEKSWIQRVRQSRIHLDHLPQPLCVQMIQLDDLLQRLPLPGLRP